MFFEAVQKTRSTCFIGSLTTRLRLVVLNPVKTLLLVFLALRDEGYRIAKSIMYGVVVCVAVISVLDSDTGYTFPS